MTAYDPKRPRPSRPSDEPAPVEALLESTATAEPAPPAPPASPAPPAASRNGSGPATRPVAPAQEVPVAPAPEIGTTNRAVLYASLGVAGLLAALLIVLRLRARRGDGSTGG